MSAFLQPTEGEFAQVARSVAKMTATLRRPALLEASSTVHATRRPARCAAAELQADLKGDRFEGTLFVFRFKAHRYAAV